jgi:hypothetical protein
MSGSGRGADGGASFDQPNAISPYEPLKEKKTGRKDG